jgi:hypothetical protein
MQSMIELLQSMRELIAGPKRRRGLKRFSGMCDGLEARQLMTAIVPGGFETEPNNSLGQHDEICVAVSGTAVSSRVNGALSVVGDPQDVYRLDLLDAVKSGTFKLSGLRANLNLQILDSEGRVLATARRGGRQAERLELGDLAAGSYFIRVFRGTADASSVYTCTFSGIRPTISRLPGAISAQATGDREPNDSRLQASSPGVLSEGGKVEVSGSLTKRDPHDWYCISLPTDGTVTVELQNLVADLDVEMQDASGTRLAISDFGGTTAEQIPLQNLPAGNYYIRVHQFGRSFSSYKLSVAMQGAVPAHDVQANDSQSEAQSLVGLQHGAATLTHGSISAVDRQDWYKISVPTGGAITAELSGLTDDLDMEVRDSAGRIVGISNNGGAIGEKISLQTLSPGDYFVRIYGYGRASSPWQLSTRVVPTDFLDVEPNNRRIHAASVGIINGQPAAAATVAAATLAQTPVPATPAARVIEGSLKADPVDWYQFQLSEEAVVTADLSSGSSGVAQLKSNRLTAGVYCLQVARDETGANFVLILTDSRARELTRVQKAANAEANYSIALNVLSESGITAAQT